MNVAIFASAFYPSLGGVEELVRQLAHEYRRKGINTIILVNQWPRSLPGREIIEGIPVYRLPMRMPEYNLRVKTNYALSFPFARAQMLRILRKHEIDLIHVQCVSGNGHYASIAARALNLPLIVTSQGERTMDAERVYEKSPFLNKVMRHLLATGDRITACSRDTLTDLETFSGLDFADRGSVVYNGIRLEDFDNVQSYQHPRPYILGIGRHVAQKGFDVLLRAFAQSSLDTHDLLLAGDGPEHGALKHLAGELLPADRVTFLGRADRPKTVSLFRGCDFFVLPSRQEPLGIVNLEAMAAGKAVIASRTGGVPEIVADAATGILVPPGEPAPLADALRKVATDSDLRQRLGAAGRDRVRQFTWEAVAASYIQIYEAAIAAKGVAPAGADPSPVLALSPLE